MPGLHDHRATSFDGTERPLCDSAGQALRVVNGASRHPLYAFPTSQDTAPEGPGDVAWNFAKFPVDPFLVERFLVDPFLVDREGRAVARFAPPTEPLSDEIVQAVERVL